MSVLPRLSRELVHTDALPEKAVQFGTGGFLRGFVDYFIDQATRSGHFGGSVVAIGSTGSDRAARLSEQDGLYTLAIQGLQGGQPVLEYRLITAVSRALSAQQEWPAVLECARNPALELVFSNTTEVGIRLEPADRFEAAPPASFPAKLTRFLYERGQAFDYAPARGLVVLPCELIEHNGERLRQLVLEQAALWRLTPEFAAWIDSSVPFCNTLVDRIVPGELDLAGQAAAAQQLGYQDDLLTACEPYRLFAIEADEATRARLDFTDANPGIIVTGDVTPYRQRKVRLLNGTHTIMVPLALLAGCETVAEAVGDELLGAFIRQVLFGELVPSLNAPEAEAFALEVMERFANPYLHHALADITLQQTMKLQLRIVPAILDYLRADGTVPRGIAFGFAGYLAYLREPNPSPRPDDLAASVRAAGQEAGTDPHLVAEAVCGMTEVWGTDLSAIPGFSTEVAGGLESILRFGARSALDAHLASGMGAR